MAVWQWTSPQYANVIVQQLLVSSGIIFAACVKAGDAYFELIISKFCYCC